jgi:hypothetical protein
VAATEFVDRIGVGVELIVVIVVEQCNDDKHNKIGEERKVWSMVSAGRVLFVDFGILVPLFATETKTNPTRGTQGGLVAPRQSTILHRCTVLAVRVECLGR